MSYQFTQADLDFINNPPEPSFQYWGQCAIEGRKVALVKGIGKVEYGPGMLNPDGSEARPQMALKFTVTPLAEMNAQYPVERELIVQAWGEYKEILLPSIKALGVMNVMDLQGRFVCVELVKDGKTYTDKNGASRESTTIKFVKVFADAATARADYLASKNGNGQAAAATPAQAAPAQAAAPSNGGDGNGNQREVALKMLPWLVGNAVRKANKDFGAAMAEVASLIAAQPVVKDYFTAESPEVMGLVAEECAK